MSITWIDYGYEDIFSYMVTVDVVYHFLKVLQTPSLRKYPSSIWGTSYYLYSKTIMMPTKQWLFSCCIGQTNEIDVGT